MVSSPQRFFYLDKGILKYAKSQTDVSVLVHQCAVGEFGRASCCQLTDEIVSMAGEGIPFLRAGATRVIWNRGAAPQPWVLGRLSSLLSEGGGSSQHPTLYPGVCAGLRSAEGDSGWEKTFLQQDNRSKT